MHDRDTGLVRFGARDYDPVTGKWTAKDPIDFGGGDLNILSYTGQDPVNWVDPEGLGGVGVSYGGGVTAGLPKSYGFRFSIHFEFRVIHDPTKSLLELGSYSLGATLTTTFFAGENKWGEKGAWGIEAGLGPDVLITDATNINQLLGFSTNSGFGGGWGAGFDTELSQSLNSCFNPTETIGGWSVHEGSYGLNVPFLFGLQAGAEAHQNVKGVTVPIFVLGGK